MSKQSKKRGEPTVERNADNYRSALARRVRLLITAGKAFDGGDDDQVVVLASILRLLLVDGLVDRVKNTRKMRFTDTAQHPAEVGAVGGIGFGITRIYVNPPSSSGLHTGGRIVALGAGPEGHEYGTVVFRDWWARDQVIYASTGDVLTREFVVYETADTDGVHVDPELDARYDSLSKDNHGFTIDGIAVSGSVAASAVRQIAWEVLNTLERELPDLFGDINTANQRFDPAGGTFYRLSTHDVVPLGGR